VNGKEGQFEKCIENTKRCRKKRFAQLAAQLPRNENHAAPLVAQIEKAIEKASAYFEALETA